MLDAASAKFIWILVIQHQMLERRSFSTVIELSTAIRNAKIEPPVGPDDPVPLEHCLDRVLQVLEQMARNDEVLSLGTDSLEIVCRDNDVRHDDWDVIPDFRVQATSALRVIHVHIGHPNIGAMSHGAVKCPDLQPLPIDAIWNGL